MAHPIPTQILTDDHYHQIKTALETIPILQAHLDQAKMAGFDTSAHQKTLDEHADRLRKIKNVYFPGRI